MYPSVDPHFGSAFYAFLFCQVSRSRGATWSLKIGHQVMHFAVERELVEAIRMRHLSRKDSKKLQAVSERGWVLLLRPEEVVLFGAGFGRYFWGRFSLGVKLAEGPGQRGEGRPLVRQRGYRSSHNFWSISTLTVPTASVFWM